MLYLDNAGATFYSVSNIVRIFFTYLFNNYGNPHSHNLISKKTNYIIEQTRELLLKKLFNTDDYYVIFTYNASNSIKMIGETFPFEDNSTLYYTLSNHNSVLGLRYYAKKYKMINDDLILPDIINNVNHLLVFPAECNFSGSLFNLNLINEIKQKNNNIYILLDASKYCSTFKLDLNLYKPDFVSLSIYKIFGYPTGLGLLLVKKDSSHILNKKYYGGGTYDFNLPILNKYHLIDSFIKQYEDGTLPYLSIIALNINLKNFNYQENKIKSLVKYCYNKLKELKHLNGTSLVKFYLKDINDHGSIITFNLLDEKGDYYDYTDVQELANSDNIYLRIGQFCNPGATLKYLNLTETQMIENFKKGHSCSNNKFIIDSNPTGAIRISFSKRNTFRDVDKFIKFIRKNFINDQINIKINNDKPYIKDIFIYPIKSCLGIRIKKEWPIDNFGLKYDRMFCIIDDNNKVISLKKHIGLSYIQPIIKDDMLIIKDNKSKKSIDFKINENIPEIINEWLSNILKINCKLSVDNSKNFSNTSQYLLINHQSILDLNYKIYSKYFIFNMFPMFIKYFLIKSFPIIKYDRFRPNIVIDGIEPYLEDDINKIYFNGNILVKDTLCKRCYTTTIDIKNNKVDRYLEPMKTLLKYRKFGNNINFGLLLNLELNLNGFFNYRFFNLVI